MSSLKISVIGLGLSLIAFLKFYLQQLQTEEPFFCGLERVYMFGFPGLERVCVHVLDFPGLERVHVLAFPGLERVYMYLLFLA
jgi:hypothetical protein